MDKEVLPVQTEETTTPTTDQPAVDQPQADTPTPEQPTEETAEEPSQEDKESKKDRDFERGMHKYREEWKTEREARIKLEEEMRALKQTPTTEINSDDPEVQAKQFLKSVVDEAIAPLKDELASTKEKETRNTFFQDPTAATLQPEIEIELESIPKNLPLSQRLDMAKGLAISKNLDVFRKVERELGAERAYANKELKAANNGIGESRGAPTSKGESVVDRVLKGDTTVTKEEYQANHADIQTALKNQVLSS